MSPEPTATPAARSSRPKSVSRPTKGDADAVRSATGSDLVERGRDEFEVIAFLDDGAQGVRGGGRVEVGGAQEVQDSRPVDRLGDPRRLGEVKLAQPIDRRHHLPGQLPRYRRLPDQ